MTTQDQIIIICILAFIAIPVGTFTIIKCINKLSRTPVNRVERTGDIELIATDNPQQNYPDLLEPAYPLNIYERVPSY